MKNLYNIGFVFLLLVVLSCNCQNRLQELAEQGKTPASSTPATNSSPAGTTNTATTSSPSTSGSGLSMDKYNQIKNGMSRSEVENIIGKGTELSSSSGGGYTFSSYQWKGEDYSSIVITFQNDKVMSKSQYGLK